jgi:hypothetical protein
MRRLWAAVAGVLLIPFAISQAANRLDPGWGVASGLAACVIGYGLLVTAPAVRARVWGGIARKRSMTTVLVTGLLTGIVGAAVAAFLISVETRRAQTGDQSRQNGPNIDDVTRKEGSTPTPDPLPSDLPPQSRYIRDTANALMHELNLASGKQFRGGYHFARQHRRLTIRPH